MLSFSPWVASRDTLVLVSVLMLLLMVIEIFFSSVLKYLHLGLSASDLTQRVVITCPKSFSSPMNFTWSSAFSLHFGHPASFLCQKIHFVIVAQGPVSTLIIICWLSCIFPGHWLLRAWRKLSNPLFFHFLYQKTPPCRCRSRHLRPGPLPPPVSCWQIALICLLDVATRILHLQTPDLQTLGAPNQVQFLSAFWGKKKARFTRNASFAMFNVY